MMNIDENLSGIYHSSDDQPGISRKKKGRGFMYFDEEGKKIIDKDIIARIKNTGIPPAWENVWICGSPLGHLQATGYDSKGRKQYLYHENWLTFQQENKFDRLLEFGYALPEIRGKIREDIKEKEWNKKKVLALTVGILDETYIRIGNKQYLELNETHGLTTLRRKHLEINSREVVFKYKAKSNKLRVVKLRNRKFAKLVKECSELPGYEVFRYKNNEGRMVPLTSMDVNEYLQSISGENFTSKNFRTWGGTFLAVKKYPGARAQVKKNPRLKLRRAIVKQVASALSNTISISEKYYIHPAVLETLDDMNFSPEEYTTGNYPESLSFEEKIVLAIIEKRKEEEGL